MNFWQYVHEEGERGQLLLQLRVLDAVHQGVEPVEVARQFNFEQDTVVYTVEILRQLAQNGLGDTHEN
jgi:hypothetical protein